MFVQNIFFLKFFAFWKKQCIFAVQFRKIAAVRQRNWKNRGVAQLASASGLGPEGPVFESQYPDKATETESSASVSFLYPPDFYISLATSRFFGVYLQIEEDCGRQSGRIHIFSYEEHKEFLHNSAY